MADATVEPSGRERALVAAEKVKERLRRATNALDAAGIPYAVAGGNAVAEWVARVDEGAVRNTREIDLLIQRVDFRSARAALESAGFEYETDRGEFRAGPQGKLSCGLRLLFAGELAKPEYDFPAPNLDESERTPEFQVMTLEALVRMELTSWRLKDRVHLRDLIDVGLIDAAWPARFPPTLAERLQQLLDNPNG